MAVSMEAARTCSWAEPTQALSEVALDDLLGGDGDEADRAGDWLEDAVLSILRALDGYGCGDAVEGMGVRPSASNCALKKAWVFHSR